MVSIGRMIEGLCKKAGLDHASYEAHEIQEYYNFHKKHQVTL